VVVVRLLADEVHVGESWDSEAAEFALDFEDCCCRCFCWLLECAWWCGVGAGGTEDARYAEGHCCGGRLIDGVF
jgi:hypothetical protein